MTTGRQLLEFLKQLPEADLELPVYVSGYEGGVGEGQPPIVVEVYTDEWKNMDYYKEHEVRDPQWPDDQKWDDGLEKPRHRAILMAR